jgi:hypothetical protein
MDDATSLLFDLPVAWTPRTGTELACAWRTLTRLSRGV